MPKIHYRLRCDVPYSFCTRPALFHHTDAAQFGGKGSGGEGVIREPLTGLLMLAPAATAELDYKPLSAWRNANNTGVSPARIHWLSVRRGIPSSFSSAALLMASMKPSHRSETDIAITPTTATDLSHAIVTGSTGDTLLWALESQLGNNIARDQSFSVQIHAVEDEYSLKRNGILIQFDDLSIRFRPSGGVAVYQWPAGAALSTVPTLVDSADLVEAGPPNRSQTYTVLPVPGVGLLIYACGPDGLAGGKGKGYLFRTRLKSDGSGPYIHAGGVVKIAVNPSSRYVLGFHLVKFPTSSETYFDGIRSVHVAPNAAPDALATAVAGGSGTSATVSLVASDGAAWNNENTTFRGKMVLSTSNAAYTPFVSGWEARWSPIFSTRDTDEWEPDTTVSLSLTDTYDGRQEGAAEVLVRTSAGRAALERGDMSYVVERGVENEFGLYDYTPVARGISQVQGDITLDHDSEGVYYRAMLSLRDFRYLASENHYLGRVKLDGLLVSEAISRVLTASGLSALAAFPTSRATVRVPVPSDPSKPLKWAPRPGDDGEKVLSQLLAMLRRKNEEFGLSFDLSTGQFSVSQRPYVTDPEQRWSLTTFSDEHDPDSKSLLVQGINLTPGPPEANVVVVNGLEAKTEGDQTTVAPRVQTRPLVNYDSLATPAYRGFLGRFRTLWASIVGVTSQQDADVWARRLFDIAAIPNLKATVTAPLEGRSIEPNDLVRIRTLNPSGTRATLLDGWITRRTIHVVTDGATGCREEAQYEIATVWTGGLE